MKKIIFFFLLLAFVGCKQTEPTPEDPVTAKPYVGTPTTPQTPIPTLLKDGDVVEIMIIIPANYDPGSKAGTWAWVEEKRAIHRYSILDIKQGQLEKVASALTWIQDANLKQKIRLMSGMSKCFTNTHRATLEKELVNGTVVGAQIICGASSCTNLVKKIPK